MKSRIIYTLLLFAMLGTTACVKELNLSDEKFEGETPIAFSFPISRGAEINAEDEIREVRLIITRANAMGGETEQLLYNEKQTVASGATSINFRLIVPVGYINIYIIGNEDVSSAGIKSLQAIDQVSQLKSKSASYAEGNTLHAPFLMYKEFKQVRVDKDGNMTIDGSVFPANDKVEIDRTVAKVTLNLECTYSSALPEGSELFLDEVQVVGQPEKPHLVPNHPYAGGFYAYVLSHTPELQIEELKNTAIDGDKFENSLVFYIPEHIAQHGAKTQLMVTAHARKNGKKVPDTQKTWHIVLGDGISGKTFAQTQYLTGAALNITRNTHYVISARIRNLKPDGELAVDLFPSVKTWGIEELDYEFQAPYLNVSRISVAVNEASTERIYFWSNQRNVMIETLGKCITGGESSFAVNNLFSNLAGSDASNFNYAFSDISFSGNGWFDVQISEHSISNPGKYIVFLKAGRVKREIEITVYSYSRRSVAGSTN